MGRNFLGVAIGVAVAVFGLSAAAQQADRFSVGLWGDMPYARAGDGPYIPALIADMNAADLAFSIYDGDIKDGGSRCDDAVYPRAAAMFDRLTAPVIYVPGDNEWTDCHRTSNGGYDNLERLDHLRQVMFASPSSFGQRTIALEHQGKPGAAYSENTRYRRGGVTFVGLNVPGSNNNKVNGPGECTRNSARSAADCAADTAEWAARNAADITWLTQSFDIARAAGDRGVMVVIQGDPGFDIPETWDRNEARANDNDGFHGVLDALAAQTRAFDGQVVLVHGDSHYFRIDKPLYDARHLLPNFTRVQTFGSPNIHWVRADVDATSRDVFTFRPMIVPGNAAKTLPE